MGKSRGRGEIFSGVGEAEEEEEKEKKEEINTTGECPKSFVILSKFKLFSLES